MTLLALDTSSQTAGVALYDGSQVLSEVIWTVGANHTMELAPAIADVFRRSGTDISFLKAVAVALGPGSFTALRIGLALAKGIALATKVPLVGIPTLDFLAKAQPPASSIMAAVLRAGRGRLVVGWYDLVDGSWQSSGRVEVLTAKKLSERINAPTWVCGEMTMDERRLLGRKRKNVLLASPAQSLRRPAYLGELAWSRYQAGQVDPADTLAPIYHHRDETAQV